MSTYAAKSGHLWTVVQSGMPEHAVQIGQGSTLKKALDDLYDTPIQSGDSRAEAEAISWAEGAWGDGAVPPWSDFEPVSDLPEQDLEADLEGEDAS